MAARQEVRLLALYAFDDKKKNPLVPDIVSLHSEITWQDINDIHDALIIRRTRENERKFKLDIDHNVLGNNTIRFRPIKSKVKNYTPIGGTGVEQNRMIDDIPTVNDQHFAASVHRPVLTQIYSKSHSHKIINLDDRSDSQGRDLQHKKKSSDAPNYGYVASESIPKRTDNRKITQPYPEQIHQTAKHKQDNNPYKFIDNNFRLTNHIDGRDVLRSSYNDRENYRPRKTIQTSKDSSKLGRDQANSQLGDRQPENYQSQLDKQDYHQPNANVRINDRRDYREYLQDSGQFHRSPKKYQNNNNDIEEKEQLGKSNNNPDKEINRGHNEINNKHEPRAVSKAVLDETYHQNSLNVNKPLRYDPNDYHTHQVINTPQIIDKNKYPMTTAIVKPEHSERNRNRKSKEIFVEEEQGLNTNINNQKTNFPRVHNEDEKNNNVQSVYKKVGNRGSRPSNGKDENINRYRSEPIENRNLHIENIQRPKLQSNRAENNYYQRIGNVPLGHYRNKQRKLHEKSEPGNINQDQNHQNFRAIPQENLREHSENDNLQYIPNRRHDDNEDYENDRNDRADYDHESRDDREQNNPSYDQINDNEIANKNDNIRRSDDSENNNNLQHIPRRRVENFEDINSHENNEVENEENRVPANYIHADGAILYENDNVRRRDHSVTNDNKFQDIPNRRIDGNHDYDNRRDNRRDNEDHENRDINVSNNPSHINNNNNDGISHENDDIVRNDHTENNKNIRHNSKERPDELRQYTKNTNKNHMRVQENLISNNRIDQQQASRNPDDIRRKQHNNQPHSKPAPPRKLQNLVPKSVPQVLQTSNTKYLSPLIAVPDSQIYPKFEHFGDFGQFN